MNDLIKISETEKPVENEVSRYVRQQAAKWKIDWERLDAAIDRHQIDNCTSYGEATAAIVGRLEAHQYPEPRRAPTCGNCFQPKDKHLPQCRLGPDADTSGWTDRALSAEELIAEGIDPKEAEEPWPSQDDLCSCGPDDICTHISGVRKRVEVESTSAELEEKSGWYSLPPCTCGSTRIRTNSVRGSVNCDDCGRFLVGVHTSTRRDLIAKAWTEGKGKPQSAYYVESEPSWESPGPCCCGEKDNLFWDSQHRSQIGCNVCGRTVTYHSPWNPDRAPALILRAWTEGKGKDGKYYYAAHEVHQTTINADHRGTVDGDSPACGCGEQPTWESNCDEKVYRLVCPRCRRRTNHHLSQAEARTEWIEVRLSENVGQCSK